jgi:hypothetical protein
LPPIQTVKKNVANPEVAAQFATGGKNEKNTDFLDDLYRGKSTGIGQIGKGWRLEENSDGRLRWRWQVKDGRGNPVTYVTESGKTGYARGSQYVGITQRDEARAHDKKRAKGKHKRRRRGATGR